MLQYSRLSIKIKSKSNLDFDLIFMLSREYCNIVEAPLQVIVPLLGLYGSDESNFWKSKCRISFARHFAVKFLAHWFVQECAEKGEDYDIVKLRDVGADETERLERKRKKKNPDQGFAGM